MSAVRVRYSAIGERWSIETVGREGTFEFGPITDRTTGPVDVLVARDENGVVVEMLVDSAVMSSDAIRVAVDAFGEQVRPFVSQTPITDLEVVLGEVDPTPTDAVIAVTESGPLVPWRVTVTVAPIPGEPGVPVAASPQLFEAPVAIDPILGRTSDDSALVRQVQIEQRAKENELVVTVNGVLPGGPWWVRLSDGQSGITVALGRLEETIVNRAVNGNLRREPAMSTRMTFGLEVPVPDLHVSVSDTPLIDVGDRDQRRRQWADDLASQAATLSKNDARYASRLWSEAAEVYRVIGDEPAAARCEERAVESRRRVKRHTLWIVVAGVAVVAGLLAAAVAIFASDDGDGVPPAIAETTAPPDTTPVTVATTPVDEPDPDFVEDAGPFELQFDPKMWGIVEFTGPTTVAPGDSVNMTIEVRVQIDLLYDRIGCEAVEIGIPPSALGEGTGPAPTYTVEARRVTSAGVASRIDLAPFAVSRTITSFKALPGSCVYDESDPAQLKEVGVIVTFAPTDVVFDIPADADPGDYELALVNGLGEGKNADGRRLAFRVSGFAR